MILSDIDIKKMLKQGRMRIAPLSEEQINGASVDLTLSDEWYFFKKQYIGKKVNLAKLGFEKAIYKVKTKTIELTSGQMCLGKTIEKITLPPDIIGTLEGRSRYARMGLAVHITSALVQPGSDNHQVLEIVNFAPFSITLHAGMRVSQVVFERIETPTSKPYATFGKIARKQ